MSNLQEIKKIPIISDVSIIKLTPHIKSKLGTKLSREAIINSKKITIYRIVYESKKHKVIGFIVEPKKGTRLPCIIYNRGGSDDFGAIKLGQLFIDLAEFANQGYLVIASQYSGNSGSEGVDQFGGDDIYDVINLYEVLKKYKRVDINKIGMYGWSRGGMMTYRCLAKVNWIKVAVVGAGPTDQVNAYKFRKGWKEHQIKMYGGSKKESIRRSALYWADKIYKKCPILIMHGTADWRVNPLDSVKLAEKLYKYKVPFRLVMFEGGDHGIAEFKSESKTLIHKWFNNYLKLNKGLPNLKPHGL